MPTIREAQLAHAAQKLNGRQAALRPAADDDESSSSDEMPPLAVSVIDDPSESSEESTDDTTMPPLYGGLLKPTIPTQASEAQESSDDSMPPLQGHDREVESSEEESSDTDDENMPPLLSAPQQRQVQLEAPDDDSSSDDSMPPLQAHDQEREGSDQGEGEPHGALERRAPSPDDSDGSMPPLHAQVEEEGDSSDGETMPPLCGVAQPSQTRTKTMDSHESSDDSMPPSFQVHGKTRDHDESSDDDSMPPLQGHDEPRAEDQVPASAEASPNHSDGSMPPLRSQQEGGEVSSDEDEEDLPPLYDLRVSAAATREREAWPDAKPEPTQGPTQRPTLQSEQSPCEPQTEAKEPKKPQEPKEAKEAKEANEASEAEEGAADEDGSASESGDSLPPLEFIKRDVEETVSIGDFVQLTGLKTPGLNGAQGYVVGLPSLPNKDSRVEVKMVSNGKTLSVKTSNVQRSAPKQAARHRPTQSLQKGDEVIVRGLTKSVEFNGQRALVLEANEDQGPDRVMVELRSGQRLSLRRDKLQLVTDSDSEKDVDRSDPMPELKCVRQKPKVEEEPCKFRIGQKVYIHLKNKPEFHGQAVFVLPSDPLRVDPGMATVQLSTGKRIITKLTHLRPEPPQDGRKGRGRPARKSAP